MFFRKKEKAVSTTPQDESSSMDMENCGAKSTAKTVKAVSNRASAKSSCGKCGKSGGNTKACSGKMSSSAKACSGKSNSKISNNCKCAK